MKSTMKQTKKRDQREYVLVESVSVCERKKGLLQWCELQSASENQSTNKQMCSWREGMDVPMLQW